MSKEIIKTKTGLQMIVDVESKARNPITTESGDRCVLHYQGYTVDGEIFDSSYDKPQPFVFEIDSGQVINGMNEGVAYMKTGETRTLIIPAKLAYGSNVLEHKLASKVLIFEITLLQVHRKQEKKNDND